MRGLLLVLVTNAYAVSMDNITLAQWTEHSKGKKVFLAMMKPEFTDALPEWRKLEREYKHTAGILIALADCTTPGGSALCQRYHFFSLGGWVHVYYGTETVSPPDGRIVAKKDSIDVPTTMWGHADFKAGDVGQGYFLTQNYCDVMISWPGKTAYTMVGCSGFPEHNPRKPVPPFNTWFTGVPAGDTIATSLQEYQGDYSYGLFKSFAHKNLGPATSSNGSVQVLV